MLAIGIYISFYFCIKNYVVIFKFYGKRTYLPQSVCSFSLENEKEQFEYDEIYLYTYKRC